MKGVDRQPNLRKSHLTGRHPLFKLTVEYWDFIHNPDFYCLYPYVWRLRNDDRVAGCIWRNSSQNYPYTGWCKPVCLGSGPKTNQSRGSFLACLKRILAAKQGTQGNTMLEGLRN
jgi:hypothetical protein